MKNQVAIAMLAAACAAYSAPDIRLSGRVVDHAGKPLGNCTVTFGQAGPSAITKAADGAFTLTGSLPVRLGEVSADPSPRLKGSRLSFTVHGSRLPVQVALHDSRGKLLTALWSGDLAAGRYGIDAMAGMPDLVSGSPAFLRLRIGNSQTSMRLPMDLRGWSGPMVSKESAPALAKSAAPAPDSLAVACPDFPAKRFLAAADAGDLGVLRIRRPNIIMVMADDVGWMDVGYQGSGYYKTPNIDKLASQSVRFPNAYAHPLCSPTRASMLTGKEPARLRFTVPNGHLDTLAQPPRQPTTCNAASAICEPESVRHMGLGEFTLAEALKAKGYQTAFFGKWHIGKPEGLWPEAHGFDVNVGLPVNPGPCSYFDPYCPQSPRLPSRNPGDYIVDRLTDEALAYIDGHKDAPFFMCLWQFGVHAPFQAKPDLIAQYEGKIDPRGKQDYPVMGAMIQSLDESMGRLQKKLADLGLDSNTIVVFYSDNGGNMYNVVQPGKPNPFPTNNHPLKMGKGNAHEGGVRVPLLIKWPGIARPNTVDSALVNQTDFYPTFLEMAGITSPSPQALDGFSLAHRLRTGSAPLRKELFCHFPHSPPAPEARATTWMRKGDWKLMRVYGAGPGRADAFELYDLGKDIGESQNVAAAHPDVVAEMKAGIQGFLARTKAITPVANPAYVP